MLNSAQARGGKKTTRLALKPHKKAALNLYKNYGGTFLYKLNFHAKLSLESK